MGECRNSIVIFRIDMGFPIVVVRSGPMEVLITDPSLSGLDHVKAPILSTSMRLYSEPSYFSSPRRDLKIINFRYL